MVDAGSLARALNVAPSEVQALVRRGMPKAARGRFDLGPCLTWLVRDLQARLASRESNASAVSVDVAAAMADTTPRTIRAWIRGEGLPILRAGNRGPGQAAVIDAVGFVRWLVARRTTAEGDLDLDQERARLAKAQADKTEQEVELRAGRMLDAGDVDQWVAGMINTAKQRLLEIPASVAARVPSEVSVQVEADTRRLLYEALCDLAAAGEQRPRGTGELS